MRPLDTVLVDVPLGEAGEDLLERHAALEPGESGTQAEVQPEAERQVLAVVAADVETVGIGVSPLVAVGRSDDEELVDVSPQRCHVVPDRSDWPSTAS